MCADGVAFSFTVSAAPRTAVAAVCSSPCATSAAASARVGADGADGFELAKDGSGASVRDALALLSSDVGASTRALMGASPLTGVDGSVETDARRSSCGGTGDATGAGCSGTRLDSRPAACFEGHGVLGARFGCAAPGNGADGAARGVASHTPSFSSGAERCVGHAPAAAAGACGRAKATCCAKRPADFATRPRSVHETPGCARHMGSIVRRASEQLEDSRHGPTRPPTCRARILAY